MRPTSPGRRRNTIKVCTLQREGLAAVYGQNIQKSDKNFRKIRQAYRLSRSDTLARLTSAAPAA